MDEESTIYRGSPSQLLNLPVFAACAAMLAIVVAAALGLQAWPVLALGIFPAAVAGWKWLRLRFCVYEVTTQRLRMSRGVMSRRTDDLELYRVNDTALVEPFFLRLLGLGNIVLTTNDTSTPVITIPALRGAREVRESLRKNVETCRDRKRVRIAEME